MRFFSVYSPQINKLPSNLYHVNYIFRLLFRSKLRVTHSVVNPFWHCDVALQMAVAWSIITALNQRPTINH